MNDSGPNGFVYGNYYDKYESNNPIARLLVRDFKNELAKMAATTGRRDFHEVGCGEGYLAAFLHQLGYRVRASDVSSEVIATARSRALSLDLPIDFKVCSIVDLDDVADRAEVIVCCEVLEHTEDPERALEKLALLANPFLILSVPREPLWRMLNMARGKYWADLGNTPGHLQHWNSKHFVALIARHMDIVAVAKPIPWTFVLCRQRSE